MSARTSASRNQSFRSLPSRTSVVVPPSPTREDEYVDDDEDEMEDKVNNQQSDEEVLSREQEREEADELPTQLTHAQVLPTEEDVENTPVRISQTSRRATSNSGLATTAASDDKVIEALRRVDAARASNKSALRSASNNGTVSQTRGSRSSTSTTSTLPNTLSTPTDEADEPLRDTLASSSSVYTSLTPAGESTPVNIVSAQSSAAPNGTTLPPNQLSIVLQYYEHLSEDSKVKLLSCFVNCLHRLLDQERKHKSMTLEELEAQVLKEEAELETLRRSAAATAVAVSANSAVPTSPDSTPTEDSFSTLGGYEQSLSDTQRALHMYWKQNVAAYKARPTPQILSNLRALVQNLKSIFQSDHINYYNANRLSQVDPRFQSVYERLRAQNITMRDIEELHAQVTKPLSAATGLAAYQHTHPAHRVAIQSMMREPARTNLALKSIGTPDFRDLALLIKPMSASEKQILSLHLSCVLP